MIIAVIGVGYWGPNIVRNLLALNHDVYIYDIDPERLRSTYKRFPKCRPARSLSQILKNSNIEAVAIAVPLPSHTELAIQFLKAGKHVFVEKPMCHSVAEANQIKVALNGQILMVGHITQFSPGIQNLIHHIQQRKIGELTRIALTRTHLGPIYKGTDVLTEVAAHDVSILLSLIDSPPQSLVAWGTHRLKNNNPDAAHIVIQWKSGLVATIDIQWDSLIRRREIEIDGQHETIFFQANSGTEHIIRYEHKNAFNALNHGANINNVRAMVEQVKTDVPQVEPLLDELAHFVRCIEQNQRPLTDISFGRRVVEILESARTSIQQNGMRITL